LETGAVDEVVGKPPAIGENRSDDVTSIENSLEWCRTILIEAIAAFSSGVVKNVFILLRFNVQVIDPFVSQFTKILLNKNC
jgi:hypothetical protein